MDLQNILLITAFVINLFLTILVYFNKGGESRLNITFSLLSLNVSFWVIAMFLHRQDLGLPHAGIALKALYVVPVFIPVIFLYFTILFTKIKFIFSEKVIARLLFVISVLISLGVIFTDKFIIGAHTPIQGEKIIKFGALYGLYVGYFVVFFTSGFFLLVRKYLTSKNISNKVRIKFVFMGTFLSSSLGMLTNLILPWFGFFELNWLGNVLTVFFVGFLSYAIIKYKLLNVKVITAELLILTIIIILLIQVFLTQSIVEIVVKSFIAVLIAIFGFLLVKVVHKEIETRERVEKLARELAEANKNLRRMERQKTEFVSIASHQLRTPLTAIKGYASMLLEGSFGKLESGVKDAIKKIYHSSQVLVVIIEDFLLVSRIEQGRMKYDFTTMDVKKIVSDMIESMRSNAEEKELSLDLQVEDDGEFNARVDVAKIEQVIHNVVGNSIRYTQKGFIKVLLSKNREKGKIRISVSDTGIGISKKMMSELFKKFSKGEDSKLGSGIGLYVAKEIIKSHKGRIWAESKGEGYGSTFFMELTEVKEEA